jgi:hypothetical protein
MTKSRGHFLNIKRTGGATVLRGPGLIAFWITLIIGAPGFSQKSSSSEFTDFAERNYKLQYPASWTLDTSKSIGPAKFFFSPLENAEDKFRENVNVLIQDLSRRRHKSFTIQGDYRQTGKGPGY